MTMSATLIHRPPADQDPDAAILIGLDGTDSPFAAVLSGNAAYAGTYSVVLVRSPTLGSGDRSVSVVFTQYSSATVVGEATVWVTYDDLTNLFLTVGEVTLPLAAIPPDNTSTTLAIQVTETGADKNGWLDLMLLDTRGQTVMTERLTGANFVYVDEPAPNVGIGPVYQSLTDRTDAFSIIGQCRISGGPLSLDPGDNRLLVYAQNGAPNVSINYRPRWLDERVE